MRKNRRKARELAMQGIYEWRVAGNAVEVIERQLQEDEDYRKCDEEHFAALLRGATGEASGLEELLRPCLDRPVAELTPVEYAILLLAAFEMRRFPDIPYRVVINEAVELAKQYGSADGYKYVNGVLDKLAAGIRAVEVAAKRAG
jgi:N utilization substance protein B